MSVLDEIRTTLPKLTLQELQAIDSAIRAELRERKIGILYDDAYGIWTEEDQTSAASIAMAIIDAK